MSGRGSFVAANKSVPPDVLGDRDLQCPQIQDPSAADDVAAIPDARFNDAVQANQQAAPLPDAQDAAQGLQAAAQEQQDGDQLEAAEQLAEEVDAAPIVRRNANEEGGGGGGEGEGEGLDLDAGPLAPPGEEI